ncbi:MAG: DUF3040 domain-containing protein [Acidimicrobiales bacterium]|nr:DUF3040 domain-containing protein [Acidimicrobiales bacterium]RZV47141.1 MAG: DUF3040 domain-containing protein [Acidimicrobiales bacterium]
MPLSEDEQRILSEIEQQLYERDPGLAHKVSNTTVFSHGFTQLRLAAAGFVFGLAVLLVTLQFGYLFAFIGFLIMFASAWYGERNLRRVGRAGIQQVTGSARNSKGYFGDASQRLRDRLNNPEDTDD